MSKSRHYFWVLAAALITLGIGHIMQIREITATSYAILAYMTSPWILVVAAISAFALGNFRQYWVAVFVTGLITSVCIHLFVLHNSADSLMSIVTLYRMLAFVVVVYLINLVRIIIGRF